jgi:hypothetical protein
MASPDPRAADRRDEPVSLYISQFQQRLPMFNRMHAEELRAMKHDVTLRLFSEYVVFGNKSTYEGLLRGMLSDEERQRLQIDPQFTRAWHIFVDLCWLKKQITRAALIVGVLVLALAAVAFCLWSLPRVAGPKNR